jgi:hypothetical protein
MKYTGRCENVFNVCTGPLRASAAGPVGARMRSSANVGAGAGAGAGGGA